MKIKCSMPQNVSYRDVNGIVQICPLRAGEHNYPELVASDPLLAEILRVLRKHGVVSFEDLLPSDVALLKTAPAGLDKAKFLKEKTRLVESPKGRVTASKKTVKRDVIAGHGPKNSSAATAPESDSGGSKPGKVSNKG